VIGLLALGAVLLVLGLLGFAFRAPLDDWNMAHTPRWMKPSDGGGVYSADQRPWRVKSFAVGMLLVAAMGAAIIVIGVVHG
jgi:hypothetical protein